ncbi:MAG TPA: mandelate racemase/muconate lactonizing enzyme family protein [Candidatus Deferrimicrobium sp.]|nr:mandelate racemase/muconate lactonizing enzyme family protein [Candidatus Deferrimicrobium sp.]
MRIARVQLHPVLITRETGVANEHVIVEIETDDGVPGWGEMSDLSHLPLYRFDLAQLQSALSEILVGSDPRALNQIERRMMGFYPDEGHMYSRSGLVRQGVELAIHDCLGRADGVPVSHLLGGALRDRIPVCYPVFRLRATDQVPAALDRVDEKLGDGFDVIRFYVGTNHAADLAFLTGFADRFAGRVRIKSLDFSNVLGWREALQATERLTGIADVMLVESPALRGDLEGLVEYRRRSTLPVSEHAHGQRHAWQLLHLGAVDILNLSPYVLGGIRPTIRAAAMAEAAGASVLLGTTQELGLGTAAVAHVGAVLPALPFPADNIGPRLYTADVATPAIQFVDGHMIVPTGPGLGPSVDPSLLESLRSDGDWSFGLDLAGAVDRTLPS